MTAVAMPYPETSRTTIAIETILANLLLIALLFPYASPRPIGTDIQPFAVVFGFFCLCLVLVVRGYVWNFDRTDLYVLGIAIIYAAWVDWSVQRLDLWYFRKNAIILLVFPAYWSVKQLYPRMSSRTVYVVAWMYLGLTLAQGFAPSLFEMFADRFLSRIVTLGGARGLTGPCPEQSFLAFLALSFPIVYKLIGANGLPVDPRADKRRFRTVVVISALLILLARSVTGIAYSALVLGILWLASAPSIKAATRRAVLAFGVLAMAATIGGTLIGARTAALLRLVVSQPRLIMYDSGIAARYVQILAGVYTIYSHPMGTGRSLGNPEVFEPAASAMNFDSYIPAESMDYIRSNRLESGDIGILSPLGDSLGRMGFVFVVELLILVAILRYPPSRLPSRLLFVLGIAASFPLSHPLYWLIFGAHEGWYLRQRLMLAPAPTLRD